MNDQVNNDEGNEPIIGTNLTTVTEFSQTAIALAGLKHRHQNLVLDVSTPKALKAAKAEVAELRTLRTGLEKKRKELKEPLLTQAKNIDEEAKRITGEIVALEEPLKLQVDAEDNRIETERLQKLEAERLRVEGHRAKINAMRELPGGMIGWPSARIEKKLAELDRGDVPDCEELNIEMEDAHVAAVARIKTMLAAQRAQEEEADRIANERAELERLRAADAERRQREEREAQERAAQEALQRHQAEFDEAQRVVRCQDAIVKIKNFTLNLKGSLVNEIADRIDYLLAMDPELVDFDFQEFHAEAVKAFDDTMHVLQQTQQERLLADAEAAAVEQARKEREEANAERAAAAAKETQRVKAEQAKERAQAEQTRLQSLTLASASEAVMQWAINQGWQAVPVFLDLAKVLDQMEAPSSAKRSRKAKQA